MNLVVANNSQHVQNSILAAFRTENGCHKKLTILMDIDENGDVQIHGVVEWSGIIFAGVKITTIYNAIRLYNVLYPNL